MNDWVPKQEGWITAGYTAYRKTCKKKHSKALFEKHVRKRFADRGIDINRISAGGPMMMELFWQAEVLKDWCFEITMILSRLEAKKGDKDVY